MHKIINTKKIRKYGSIDISTEDGFIQSAIKTAKHDIRLVMYSTGEIEIVAYGTPKNIKITTFKDIPVNVVNRNAFSYVIIQTLNGNFILKEMSKAKITDNVEIELYGSSLEDIKIQYREHLNGLKKDGLI